MQEMYRQTPRPCRECKEVVVGGLCDNCKAKEEKAEYEAGKQRWQDLRSAKKDNFEEYIKACGVPKIFRGRKDIALETGSVLITGGCGA